MSETEFKHAYDNAKNLKSQPSTDDQLELYALGKIGTGAVKDDKKKPGMFDIAGKKKWEAWTKKIDAGVTKEAAQKQYVAKFNELSAKLGTK